MCEHHAAIASTPLNPVTAALGPLLGDSRALAFQHPEIATQGGATAPISTPVSTPVSTQARAPRRKLWELAHKLHCPVVGTCLHLDELSALARKTGTFSPQGLSEFELHVRCVAAADTRNPLAVAMHKTLERKYAKTIAGFAACASVETLREQWRACRAAGEVPGAFWAVLTHPVATPALATFLYEEVHMLSHQIGAGLVADAQALVQARAALAQLRAEQAASERLHARRQAARDARVSTLEAQAARTQGLRQQLQAAQARIAALESGQVQQDLALRLEQLERELERHRHRLHRANAEGEQLRAQLTAAATVQQTQAAALAAAQAERQILESLLPRQPDESAGDPPPCAGTCCAGSAVRAHLDLGRRRILCVGGRDALAARYRELVERSNGEWVRHDGGIEDNRQRLDVLLASADAVVCPADCVSHDAYLRTKRHCKRTAKPCVLIERSSLGAFADALLTLSGVEPLAAPSATAALAA